jgi:hypothetical protein
VLGRLNESVEPAVSEQGVGIGDHEFVAGALHLIDQREPNGACPDGVRCFHAIGPANSRIKGDVQAQPVRFQTNRQSLRLRLWVGAQTHLFDVGQSITFRIIITPINSARQCIEPIRVLISV